MPRRTFVVTRSDARRTVAEFLHRHLGLKWNAVGQLVQQGGVFIDDKPCRDSTQRLQRGQRLSADVGEKRPKKSEIRNPKSEKKKSEKPAGSSGIVIRFVDEQVVVV